MDFQTIAAIVFVALLAVVLYLNRNRVVLQKVLFPLLYVVMYRTKVGIAAMDKTAKRVPRLLRYTGHTAVVVGFLGMIFIIYSLIENLYKVLFTPHAVSGVGIIQPFSAAIPGTFYVPFFYFIISIFLLVVVHEFSHGVMARVYGLKIKSSGLAFLGILLPILPAAFVEPDEKKMRQRPAMQQLSIFAAGPFANIVTAAVVLGLLIFVAQPVVSSILEPTGVLVDNVQTGQGYPAEAIGIMPGELITALDGTPITTQDNFSAALQRKSPGDTVTITTNRTEYQNVVLGKNPSDPDKPYLGVFVKPHSAIRDSFTQSYGTFTAEVILWLAGLLVWLYVLNVGIGLFNLAPIPIVDGGRMAQLALQKMLPEKHAVHAWKAVCMVCTGLILANIFIGFLK